MLQKRNRYGNRYVHTLITEPWVSEIGDLIEFEVDFMPKVEASPDISAAR